MFRRRRRNAETVVGPGNIRYNLDMGGWPLFLKHAAEHGYKAVPFCSWLRGMPSFPWEQPDKIRFIRSGLIVDMDVFTVEQSEGRIWSYLDAGFNKAKAAKAAHG